MDDKDVIIDRLMRRIDSLLEQNAQLSRRYQKQVDQLTDKIKTLSAENLELKEHIARLEKNSATSSQPPSSDIIHPLANAVKKRKHKRGGQQEHPKHVRQPFPNEAIDEMIVHKLSDEEVKRRQWVVLSQTALALEQISLPKKLYRITEHRVQLYRTRDGKIISAILPPEIRKSGLFAPDMTALVGYLKGRCHASTSTLRAILTDIFGLNIECGYQHGRIKSKKVGDRKAAEVLASAIFSPVGLLDVTPKPERRIACHNLVLVGMRENSADEDHDIPDRFGREAFLLFFQK